MTYVPPKKQFVVTALFTRISDGDILFRVTAYGKDQAKAMTEKAIKNMDSFDLGEKVQSDEYSAHWSLDMIGDIAEDSSDDYDEEITDEPEQVSIDDILDEIPEREREALKKQIPLL